VHVCVHVCEVKCTGMVRRPWQVRSVWWHRRSDVSVYFGKFVVDGTIMNIWEGASIKYAS
jgi:hypothetical protein